MPPRTRRDNGAGSLSYSAKSGLWTAYVSLPPGPDGKRRRKVARSKSKEAATKKLREMRRELDATGDLTTSSPTVAAWLDTWLVDYSARRVRPTTQTNRASDVRLHITPAIGRRRLDKLTPADVTTLARTITDKGNSSTTALRCHRLLSVALRDAVRAGKVTRNVATREYVDAPRAAVRDGSVLTPTQTVAVLRTASTTGDRYTARWALALLAGVRRGEALGLEWDRVVLDGDDPHAVLSWQLQRLPWAHGCTKTGHPVCGRKRGADCPKARMVIPDGMEARQVHHGLYLTRPKTRKSWRVVPLVGPLHSYLLTHQAATGRTTGMVFTEPDGAPIDPRDDGARWKGLLEQAGAPHVRLHDARHGAASLMLSAGVDTRVVSEILGHNSAAMTQHYQHTDRTMTRDALTRLAAALPGLTP